MNNCDGNKCNNKCDREKHNYNLSSLIQKFVKNNEQRKKIRDQIKKTIDNNEYSLGLVTEVLIDFDEINIDVDTQYEPLELKQLLIFLKDNDIEERSIMLDSKVRGKVRIIIRIRD